MVYAGLAHRLGSLEGVISELSRRIVAAQVRVKSKPVPSISAPQSTRVLRTPIEAIAQTPEQLRILGVMALAKPGSEYHSEVYKAIDEGLSIEAAALKILKSSQAHGGPTRPALLDPVKPSSRSQQFSTGSIWCMRRSLKV